MRAKAECNDRSELDALGFREARLSETRFRGRTLLPSTASVMIIDPIMSGKHIGASQLIEAGSQHLYETMTDACSVYQFNGYEYSCIIEMLHKVGRGERKCIKTGL